jgi:hypothetical protein
MQASADSIDMKIECENETSKNTQGKHSSHRGKLHLVQRNVAAACWHSRHCTSSASSFLGEEGIEGAAGFGAAGFNFGGEALPVGAFGGAGAGGAAVGCEELDLGAAGCGEEDLGAAGCGEEDLGAAGCGEEDLGAAGDGLGAAGAGALPDWGAALALLLDAASISESSLSSLSSSSSTMGGELSSSLSSL